MLSWLCTFCGFLTLALAMPRNCKILLRSPNTVIKDTYLRCVGFVLLTISLFFTCQHYPLADGIVMWSYQLTVCALVIAFTLSFRANKAR